VNEIGKIGARQCSVSTEVQIDLETFEIYPEEGTLSKWPTQMADFGNSNKGDFLFLSLVEMSAPLPPLSSARKRKPLSPYTRGKKGIN